MSWPMNAEQLNSIEETLTRALILFQTAVNSRLDQDGDISAELGSLYYILAAHRIVRGARKFLPPGPELGAGEVISTFNTVGLAERVRENSRIPDDKKTIVIARLSEMSEKEMSRREYVDELLDIQSELTVGSNCRCGGDHVGRMGGLWDCVKRYFGKGRYYYDVDSLLDKGYTGMPREWHVYRIRKDQFPAQVRSQKLMCGGWTSGRQFLVGIHVATGPNSDVRLAHAPMTFPDGSSAFKYVEKLRSGQPLHGWKASSIIAALFLGIVTVVGATVTEFLRCGF